MKKLILAAFALTAAASVFAQGTIVFNNNIPGTIITTYLCAAGDQWSQHVRLPGRQRDYGTYGDFPSGTVNWSAWYNNNLFIGNNGLTGQFGGSDTLVELLAAPGLGDTSSSLVAATVGLRPSGRVAIAGYVAAVTPTFAN